MKIIHCADIHLDSAMTSHSDPESARKRRGEMLRTFERMVSYAAREGVSAILIAGDLFDAPNTRELTRNTVLHCIASNPAIAFFYLKGNHDDNNFLNGLDELGKKPCNLLLFGRHWGCYECGGVAIYGAELHGGDTAFYDGLQPDAEKINIVMLHGQISENPAGVEHGIDLKQLRGRNIDYLALGHIHAPGSGRLDDRGTYCYPGCLEGRGFDECGERGFMLLDIDEESRMITRTFVPFAGRKIVSVSADITGCMTTQEMIITAAEALSDAECDASSIVRLVLTGELDAECEKDIAYLTAAFAEKYDYFETADETRLTVDMDDYLLDQSLKGEFIRTVFGDGTLSDEDKAVIVRYGLRALAGEEAD